jgi:hypothetical protein
MDDNIVRGIFSLLVAAVAGLMGYSSAIRAIVRKDQNAAALEFRDTFNRTIYRIDPNNRPPNTEINVVKVLESDFEGHFLAVMKFKQFLNKDQIKNFETAWLNYHALEIEVDDEKHYWHRHFIKYHTKRPGVADTDIIIKNINFVLSFAKLNHKSPFDPVETENC